jgi:hypothetical protein
MSRNLLHGKIDFVILSLTEQTRIYPDSAGAALEFAGIALEQVYRFWEEFPGVFRSKMFSR